jgi:hypothetical protein
MQSRKAHRHSSDIKTRKGTGDETCAREGKHNGRVKNVFVDQI